MIYSRGSLPCQALQKWDHQLHQLHLPSKKAFSGKILIGQVIAELTVFQVWQKSQKVGKRCSLFSVPIPVKQTIWCCHQLVPADTLLTNLNLQWEKSPLKSHFQAWEACPSKSHLHLRYRRSPQEEGSSHRSKRTTANVLLRATEIDRKSWTRGTSKYVKSSKRALTRLAKSSLRSAKEKRRFKLPRNWTKKPPKRVRSLSGAQKRT